jgi:hypothetical protein
MLGSARRPPWVDKAVREGTNKCFRILLNIMLPHVVQRSVIRISRAVRHMLLWKENTTHLAANCDATHLKVGKGVADTEISPPPNEMGSQIKRSSLRSQC